MKKLKNNKKGFTLVEIIVVIVILAVLMAVAVPSVLGYISEADNAKLMAQARSVLTTAQAEVVKEQVTSDGLKASEVPGVKDKVKASLTNEVPNLKAITTLYTGKVTYDESKKDATGTAMSETGDDKITASLSAVKMNIDGKTIIAITNDKVYIAE